MSQSWFPDAAKSDINLDAYLAEYGNLPVPDRSNVKRNRFVSQGQADLGIWISVINDGGVQRPLVVETWASEGNATYQTCFFSRIGAEDKTAQGMLDLFSRIDFIVCREDTPCNLVRIVDANGHPIWSFTLCIGSEDSLYVTRSFPYQAFPESAFL